MKKALLVFVLIVMLCPAAPIASESPVLLPAVYLPFVVRDPEPGMPTSTPYPPPTPTPIGGPYPTQTPTPVTVPPTPTPTPGEVYWQTLYVKNLTGGQLCYEVVGSGIPARCMENEGPELYGTYQLLNTHTWWVMMCDGQYMSGQVSLITNYIVEMQVNCGYVTIIEIGPM